MHRYLVMLLRQPQFEPAVVPRHLQYLEQQRAQGRIELSGPFGDASGGAYLLRANDLDEALGVAHADPAHLSGGWRVAVYEWRAR